MGGRPPLALELVMRGILVVLSQGCKWRAIECSGANWNSVYQYFRRWAREGVLAELFAGIELPLRGTRRFLDTTHVKLHRCACNPSGGQAFQAMGRTKGGMNSKVGAIVDEAGQPIRLLLSAGNEADISHAQPLIEEIPRNLLAADKAFDSDPLRAWLFERGITPCIPSRSNRLKPCRFSRASYRKRHLVENFFERIKNFRRVATRYDKLAETYLAFVCLAATLVRFIF